MSLVYGSSVADGIFDAECSRCGMFIGRLTNAEVGDLVSRGISPLCFDCEGGADVIPEQLYLAEDVFLLGAGNLSFLCHWMSDTCDPKQTDLDLRPITNGLWYALKTGDIRFFEAYNTLSSSEKVITIDVEEVGVNV